MLPSDEQREELSYSPEPPLPMDGGHGQRCRAPQIPSQPL